MNRTVVWTNRGLREFEALDPPVADRVAQAIEVYAATGQGNVRPLTGRRGEWRLKAGSWRVIFSFIDRGRTIEILRVGHRREVYRRR